MLDVIIVSRHGSKGRTPRLSIRACLKGCGNEYLPVVMLGSELDCGGCWLGFFTLFATSANLPVPDDFPALLNSHT